MLRSERPDSIIVTLPKRFFEEYSHAKYLEEIEFMTKHPGEMIWYRACKNLPKIEDLLYVYTVIDNKIHHRAMFAGLLRNHTMTFPRPEGGERTFQNSNFIMTSGPIVMAPTNREWPFKGFQGFRYIESENYF